MKKVITKEVAPKTEEKAAKAVTEKIETEKKAETVKAETVKAETVKKAEEAPKKAEKVEEKAEKATKKVETAVKKAEQTVKSAETKAEKAVKSAETKVKAAVKKTTAKKEVVKEAVYLQFSGKEVSKDELIAQVKDVWTKEMKKKAADLKSIALYLKPEDEAAYYVINDSFAGKIDL